MHGGDGLAGIRPITLEGRRVRLEPLSRDHASGLARAGRDEEVWKYLPALPRSEEEMRRWVDAALELRETGTEMPFAIVERAGGEPIGSTRIMDIRREHRGVEIGYSWLGRAWWRTAVNTECKYLLLHHLFDELGCIRVALKTDLLNERSWRAIERLGAAREGVLRNHMIMREGRYRDSVYYSITCQEWPAIRERLETRVASSE